MDKNEMDFLWRLNWWYRPIQCDGIETSVTDYYESFCDWKDTMEINARPAGETDYVDAFIQGLKPDIRLRLESKEKTSTKRLGVAFYDAKLEESLMSIDEAFKKIKAKFEAHKPFDKMSVQFNSEKEKGLIVVASYIDESQIDKRAEKVTPRFATAKEEAVIELDHGHSEITDSSLTDSCSNELAENLSDYEFSGLEDDESLQIELEKETHKMLDNLPDQNLCESSSIDQESDEDDVDSITANEISIGKTGDVKDELLLKSKIKQGLKPFSVKFFPIYTVEKVELLTLKAGVRCMNMATEFVPAELGVVKVAYQVFDEMPRQLFGEQRDEISGDVYLLPPIDCHPRVFDPGTPIINGDLGAFDMLNMPIPSLCMNHELSQPTGSKSFLGKLDCDSSKSHGAIVSFSFDPGGSYYLLRAWHWNDDFEIFTEQQGHNMTRKNGKYVLFSFDPGGNASSYENALLHEVAQHIEPLVVGLICDRLLESMVALGTEMVWQDAVVHIQKLRGLKGASIVVSFAHCSEKDLDVKDSSAENEMEGCSSGIIFSVMDLLRLGKLVLGLLLSELKHSIQSLRTNGYDCAVAVKLQNSVWDPGQGIVFLYTLECFTFNFTMSWSRKKRKKGELNMKEELNMGIQLTLALTSKQDENLNGVSAHDNVHKELLVCTSVNAFRRMGFDCEDKFNALSLVLMTMQTGVFSIFVWDPGLCAITAYILMDRAGFEMHNRCENFELNVDQEDFFLVEKTQSCTTIVGSHRWDVNVCLLVSLAAGSAPAWLALHNIDVTNTLRFVLVIVPTKVYILGDKDDFVGEGKMMRKIERCDRK